MSVKICLLENALTGGLITGGGAYNRMKRGRGGWGEPELWYSS